MSQNSTDLIRQAQLVLEFNWAGITLGLAPGFIRINGPGTQLSSPSGMPTTIKIVPCESYAISSTTSGQTGCCRRLSLARGLADTSLGLSSGMRIVAHTPHQAARPPA